jgi:hypothetical protein
MSTGFSLESYRRLLDLALHLGWSFRSFASPTTASNDKVIFLRHDVDYSVQAATELARVNHDAGVEGTFFLLLRGDVYNLLSPPNLERAREIASLGQAVALHFALPSPPPSDVPSLVTAIEHDHRLLLRELPMLAPVFSWHNPTPEQTGDQRDVQPSGMLNAYGRAFTQQAKYASDSNLRLGFDEFAELIQTQTGPLQLLFHPINWVLGQGESDMTKILSRTWERVIRERENDFRFNRVYHARLPDGMPHSVVEQFTAAWRDAAQGHAP